MAQDLTREAATASPFWTPALGAGAATILSLYGDIDSQSQQVARMPIRAPGSRPLVSHYLSMVKTLAAAWRGHSRVALAAALASLGHVGDSLATHEAPALLAALRNGADCTVAARLVDAVIRHLAAPAAAFGQLHRDFDSYLVQMGAASADLEADTVVVTQHLQAEQVHAFILAQQVNMLQAQLDEARERLHAPGIAAAELVRQEVALHAASLDSVRSQLGQIQSSQAQTVSEAAYLQGLLPTLASYLGQLDRMGGAIHALLAATCALQAGLHTLRLGLLDGNAPPGLAQDVRAALPCWSALAARGLQEASRRSNMAS